MRTLHEYTDPRPVRVVAKARKRCPDCWRMIERGEEAILTDDRHLVAAVQWHGRRYVRGAWHLRHPACADAGSA